MEWTKVTPLPTTTLVKVNGKPLNPQEVEILPPIKEMEEMNLSKSFKAKSYFFLAPLLMFQQGTVDLIKTEDIENGFRELEKFFDFIYEFAGHVQSLLWVVFGCVIAYYCILLAKDLFNFFRR